MDVAGEEPDHDVVARLEGIEELWDARKDVAAVLGRAELLAQQVEIALEHLVDALVDVRIGHPRVAHQLAHDLGIGLAVEAMLAGPRLSEVLLERLEHGAAAGSVAPQDGPVDVEQHDAPRARRLVVDPSNW